ncbi:MAG: type II secretion system protein N, partial [Akkermansiaceae bacterium]|nr:type II secretion system protein N [Akkermansiaceae bacterium]
RINVVLHVPRGIAGQQLVLAAVEANHKVVGLDRRVVLQNVEHFQHVLDPHVERVDCERFREQLRGVREDFDRLKQVESDHGHHHVQLELPGLGGVGLTLSSFDSRWPADLLVGLGTPWNTLRMQGNLALQSSGLALRVDQGRANMQGVLTVDALDIASRLSTLRPLGSYRMELRAAPDGHTATLNLSTLRGDLQLQGSGQWVGGRLRFSGVAEAATGREVALTNLLNIIGKRQGTRSAFNIG